MRKLERRDTESVFEQLEALGWVTMNTGAAPDRPAALDRQSARASEICGAREGGGTAPSTASCGPRTAGFCCGFWGTGQCRCPTRFPMTCGPPSVPSSTADGCTGDRRYRLLSAPGYPGAAGRGPAGRAPRHRRREYPRITQRTRRRTRRRRRDGEHKPPVAAPPAREDAALDGPHREPTPAAVPGPPHATSTLRVSRRSPVCSAFRVLSLAHQIRLAAIARASPSGWAATKSRLAAVR